MQKEHDKIGKILEFVQREGIIGLKHLRIFNELVEYTPKHSEIRHKYPLFFGSIIESNLCMALLSLGNLLKDDKDSMSINYFLNLVKQEKIHLAEVQKDEQELRELRKEAEPLIAMRDKIFAHVDKKHVNDHSVITEIFNNAKRREVENLYQRASSIVNKYPSLLGISTVTQWEISDWQADFHEIFILLDLGYEAREKRKQLGIFDKYEKK